MLPELTFSHTMTPIAPAKSNDQFKLQPGPSLRYSTVGTRRPQHSLTIASIVAQTGLVGVAYPLAYQIQHGRSQNREIFPGAGHGNSCAHANERGNLHRSCILSAAIPRRNAQAPRVNPEYRIMKVVP